MKIGLNVGSGQRPFHSTSEVQWINIDSQEKWNPDILCDAARIPMEDESVDYFILHHVLEHFGCNEGDTLLREAHRLLKPGGSLIVSVPDTVALAQRFLRQEISAFIYFANMYGAYMGSENDRHKWGYTIVTLSESLANAAEWKNKTLFNNRSIPGASIAADWWILSMEAIK